jgi:hypothetical protein
MTRGLLGLRESAKPGQEPENKRVKKIVEDMKALAEEGNIKK